MTEILPRAEAPSASPPKAGWWEAPWHFAIHVVVGTAIFSLVAGAAVSLSLLVNLLKARQIDGMILIGLTIGEYAIFVSDLILFLVFLLRTTVKTFKELQQ